jgi:hypothetical protein
MFGRKVPTASAIAILSLGLTAFPADQAEAATVTVTNCQDSGAGSLRRALANALSGDTIDMRALACTRIALLTGPLTVAQHDLTLLGPGRRLLLDGRRQYSVLQHSGNGTLLVRGLQVGYGNNHVSPSHGGCIGSAGNLVLQNVNVHDCRAAQNDATGGGVAASELTIVDSDIHGNTVDDGVLGEGGGVHASRGLTLLRSRIFDNDAGMGVGGGVYDTGGLRMSYSEISDNHADGSGGIYATKRATVSHSAINRNHASYHGGAYLAGQRTDILVIDSTISGNTAGWHSGLSMWGEKGNKSIINSTIVSNIEQPTDTGCAGGLQLYGPVLIESSIVAGNLCDDNPLDIVGGELEGANNLIQASTVPVPPDTIAADPRLGSLALNGGLTRTHLLLSDSPAIDSGSNVGGAIYDQRGPGFPRVKGVRADIGAYER